MPLIRGIEGRADRNMTTVLFETGKKSAVKKTGIALGIAMTIFAAGCSAAAPASQQTAADEQTQQTASADPVNEVIEKISEGKFRKAIEAANMARITAKTNHSLPEETIEVLDSLYAYCQIHEYLENDDIAAAKPWTEKINPDLLPEQVRTLYDELYAQYKDEFEKPEDPAE